MQSTIHSLQNTPARAKTKHVLQHKTAARNGTSAKLPSRESYFHFPFNCGHERFHHGFFLNHAPTVLSARRMNSLDPQLYSHFPSISPHLHSEVTMASHPETKIDCSKVYVKQSTFSNEETGMFDGAFALASFKEGDLVEKGVMRRLPEGFDGNTCPYIFTWSTERPNKVSFIDVLYAYLQPLSVYGEC